jgi:hypothetical protein
MKKIILSLSIVAITAVFATQIQAAPKNSGSKNGSVTKSQGNAGNKTSNAKTGTGSQQNLGKGTGSNKINNYHLQHGTKFEHGYFYKGKNHQHWGETRFDHRYGCNIYWDSCLSIWFYWCERDICYYPVSYCPYRTYVCPVEVVEVVRPVRVVEVIRPVVVVREVVVERPVCECQPILAGNCGASVELGGVLRTGYRQPIHREYRHSEGRR